MQPEHLGNFAQRQLFVIVEAENRALDLGDLIDRFRQEALQLRLLQKDGGEVLFRIRNDM